MKYNTSPLYPQHYAEQARRLYHLGYEPVPIQLGRNHCRIPDWPRIPLPIEPWPPYHGIGLRTGRHIAIDIDVLDEAMVISLMSDLHSSLGRRKLLNDFQNNLKEQHIFTRTGRYPKILIPAICPEITKKVVYYRFLDHQDNINAIELLSYGQMYMASGIHPKTGRPYRWDGGSPLDTALPVVSVADIRALLEHFYALAIEAGWRCIDRPKKLRTAIQRKEKDPFSLRPGDLMNGYCQITDLLSRYGWSHHSDNRWTRPGKAMSEGASGTVLGNRLYVFSSSIPELRPETTYDCFGLYSAYQHKGDHRTAATALRRAMRERKQ